MNVLVVVYDNIQNVLSKLNDTNVNYHICYINLYSGSNVGNQNINVHYINNIDSVIVQSIIEDNYPIYLDSKSILTQGYNDYIISCIIHQVLFVYTHVLIINDYNSFNDYSCIEYDTPVVHTCNSKVVGYSGCIYGVKDLLNYFFDINILHDSGTCNLDHKKLLSKNANLRKLQISFKSTQKVLVCLYGVIARSIKYTIHGFKKTVFEPLEKHGLDYDILVVNNNVGDTLVDGVSLNHDDYKVIHDITKYIELTQDKITNKHIRKDYPVSFKTFMPGAPKNTGLNGLRQLYTEYTVSQNLDSNKYAKCITLCSDLFFNESIPINTLLESKYNEVYVSSFYTFGIPNGLYFGCTYGIKRLLNHYPYLYNMKKIKTPRMKNYEAIIRLSGIYNKVNVKRIPYRFIKIRANKHPNMQMNDEHKNIINNALKIIEDVDSGLLN